MNLKPVPAELHIPENGLLRLRITSRRPLKLWLGRHLLADEDLLYSLSQREMRLEVLVPVTAGSYPLTVELGRRPHHMRWVDDHCPSRNRAATLEALARRFPDTLEISDTLEPGGSGPAVCLRWGPAQMRKNGLLWQEVLVRELDGFRPLNRELETWDNQMLPPRLHLSSAAAPNLLIEAEPSPVQGRGGRRVYVPVTGYGGEPPAARAAGNESRAEPYLEEVGRVALTVEDQLGAATVSMPVYESTGKGAPRREHVDIPAPDPEEVLAAAPRVVLPEAWAGLAQMYEGAWRMLCRLWSPVSPLSGMPCGYVRTAEEGFTDSQFVWDTGFTMLSTRYAWRAFPHLASFDGLYSRQQDGGYLHRHCDVRYNIPVLFEPDFSPNPPMMAVTELETARISGDTARLAAVYPLLADQFAWLKHNRRLPDGTYWTTGLANGLDNSPSLGLGYPCLTSQMAQVAGSLAVIAALLDKPEDAETWSAEKAEIAAALNARLWNAEQEIYCTSLEGGGHNPNKVVTAFWPLWADCVPADRVAALERHALDPASFNRHHPMPSLAADSPQYEPGGNYWRGSVWTPTSYAALKGLWRAGARQTARELTLRHLQCMAEVFAETGVLWENYCPEKSARGSVSHRNYSWTSVSPVALLLEVVLGLEPDAVQRRLVWRPWPGKAYGVNHYPLGPCTVSLHIAPVDETRAALHINTDLSFTLAVEIDGFPAREITLPAGYTKLDIAKSPPLPS
ncbi:MAG: hypothetical protein JJU05_01925 [Verrucomicrobia bacterium]|nr:hypothetical protein [Verrucomicrobiota bacterium]MCH8526167.1 hypothetical protein [Kiritimatiellia bacterium]